MNRPQTTRFLESRKEQSFQIVQPVRAATDLIWKACASARGLARWQADEVEGEVSPGGPLRLYWRAFGASVELSVIEVLPYQRLRLRNGSTEVAFELEEESVVLTQYGLDPDDDIEGLRSSWRVALAQMAHSVERHPGRQRHVEWAVSQVRVAPETLHLFLTDRELLRLWLGQVEQDLTEGVPYQMAVHDGPLLEGTVLACVPGRDLAISCTNLSDTAVVFRTLPSPLSADERLVAVSVSQWGRSTRAGERLIERIGSALNRLTTVLTRGGSA